VQGTAYPTAAGARCRENPVALWENIVARLPSGTREVDRHAGWIALAVAGSGLPAEAWRDEIGDLLLALGWRVGRVGSESSPSARSPTLDVLVHLAGAARTGWRLTGADPAVAATARAVIRPGL
jgi:hypothetical protein